MKRKLLTVKSFIASLILILAILSLSFGLYFSFGKTVHAEEIILAENSNIQQGWESALSASNAGNQVVVILETDWNLSNGTPIDVPDTANVKLNLNGHTITGVEGLSVFIVGGKLEITDNSEEQTGTVTGGSAVQYGGGVLVNAGGEFTLSGGNITGNTAGQYGGGVCVIGGTFIMNGGNIYNNTVFSDDDILIAGGGVCVKGVDFSTQGGTFVMKGGNIYENKTGADSVGQLHGGGVAVIDAFSKFEFNGGDVSINQATNGGGIFVYCGTLIMNEGSGVFGNVATSDGGGVYVLAGKLKMEGGTISKDSSGTYNTANMGGGIYAESSEVNLGEGSITYNRAVDGGGIYLYNSNLNLNYSAIEDNIATGDGGGIYINEQSSATINGGSIKSNGYLHADEETETTSTVRGGGIYSGGTLVINGGTITENHSGSDGAGINSDGTLKITGGEITNNGTGNDGGGIYSGENSRLEITGGTICGNMATQNGGGIYSASENILLSGGEIIGNDAAGMGGGVYAVQGLSVSGSAIIKDNKVVREVEGSDVTQTNNVYLNDGIISIADKLDEIFSIGVTLKDYSSVFTNRYTEYCSSEDGYAFDASDYFKSDSTTYKVAYTVDNELKLVNDEVKWFIKFENEDDYIPVYDYGVSFAYETKKVEHLKFGDEEISADEYGVNEGTYRISKQGYLFTIIIKPATFTVKFANAEFEENRVIQDVSLPVTPPVIITTQAGATYPDSDDSYGDFSVSYENNDAIGDATVTITPNSGNYIQEDIVLRFTIVKADAKPRYNTISWQYYNETIWTTTAEFTYSGEDLSKNVRAVLTAEGSDEQTVVEYGNTDWNIIFKLDGKESDFRVAGTYTVTLEPLKEQILETGATTEATIKRDTLSVDFDEIFGATENDSVMGAWLLNIGSNADVYLLDGSQVVYEVKDDNGDLPGTANGISGEAYAYYRKDGEDSIRYSLVFNEAYDNIGSYLSGFDENGETDYVRVSYSNQARYGGEDDFTEISDVRGSENETCVTVMTTATVTFDNYALTDGNNSFTVSKIWNIVTAVNTLKTFDDSSNFEYKDVSSKEHVWTYGDEHGENSKLLSYMFRPAYGVSAFYTITSDNPNYEDEVFEVRFTNDLISFWTDSGTRIKDKFYLYDYLEELDAGNYTITVRVPATVSDGSNREWWNGGGIIDDYGMVYAGTQYSCTVTVNRYELPETVTLKELRDYYYTDGPLSIRYLKRISYDALGENLPEVALVLNGRQIASNDYSLTVSKQPSNGKTGNAEFTITAVEGGNISGSIAKLPFEIAAGVNGFDDFGIVPWKYGSFDGEINVITAKPVAGKVTIDIYANNRTVIDDDNFTDVIDRDKLVLEMGEVQIDEYGAVELNDGLIEEFKALDAGVYWLFARAEDENGIYNTITRQTKFIVLSAENYWTVMPGVVSWKYGGYDREVNTVAGSSFYGKTVFSIYRQNGASYSLIEFDGKTSFKLNEGRVPEEVSKALEKLDTGKYFLCATVAGTVNYSGLNERFDITDIADFPPFNVFGLDNSWSVQPGVVSWTYGGYDSTVNLVAGAPLYGKYAIFSVYRQNGELIGFEGETSFVLDENGFVPDEVSKKFSTLEAGNYYLRALVPHTENYTGLNESDSDITRFAPFSVHKFANYWTENPSLPGWKWNEYDPLVNVIMASSASEEALVRLKISYVLDGVTIYLNFGENNDEFTLEDGKVPKAVSDVLAGLNAGITYTISAFVEETDNYTGLPTLRSTFEIIPQTNFWETTPNIISWRYGEYDINANAVNGKPAYGENATFSIYKEDGNSYTLLDFGGKTTFTLTEDGLVPEEVSARLSGLDVGLYYLRARVAGTVNYSGLDENDSDVTRFTPFSVIKVNNYWQTMPSVASWRYGEYDRQANAIFGKPAYGERAAFSIYKEENGRYTLLEFRGKTTFTLTEDGLVPEEVSEKLALFDAGRYYLRAMVGGTVNYTGLDESDSDVTKFARFGVIKVENYWSVQPGVLSWRYGEYDITANAISALPAYGDTVVFSIYALTGDRYTLLEFEGKSTFSLVNGEVPASVASKLVTLDAGTYYLRASVAGTVNYSGLNESVDDVTKLASFSVVKVSNEWENGNVPAIMGWSEGRFNAAVNSISGLSKYGEVKFTITDEKNNEVDITSLASLKVGSYVLHAYVEGSDNYFELSATTTFAVFEDSVGLSGLITATVVFSVLAIALAVTAILLLIRRNKKIEEEFRRVVYSELGIQ